MKDEQKNFLISKEKEVIYMYKNKKSSYQYQQEEKTANTGMK